MKIPILVYGDIMLDQYIDGTVKRISPEAPVPVVHVQQVYNAIGGCGNVSHGIVAMGSTQLTVSFAANDAFGTILKKELKQKNITAHLLPNGFPTIAKVRVVSNKHQLLRYDVENIAPLKKTVVAKVSAFLQNTNFDLAIISDYGKGACSSEICQCIISKAKTLVDPKSSDWTKYSGAFLVSPNFKEFTEALGYSIANEDEAIEKAAFSLIDKYNIENILVTRSAKGMSLISKKAKLHIGTAAKEVYDVTGAGDTVIATIGAMLQQGKKLIDAVKLANKAAAIAVGHFGTYAVTKKELNKK